MQISLLRFFKKINKLTLCVGLMRILFHQCSFFGYFWLMQICQMRIVFRTKSRIRQKLSVFSKLVKQLFRIQIQKGRKVFGTR